MMLHPIVKCRGKYWMLESIENEIATLWRDGISEKVSIKEIEYVESVR